VPISDELERASWDLRKDGVGERVVTSTGGQMIDLSNLMTRMLKPTAVEAGLGEWGLRFEFGIGFASARACGREGNEAVGFPACHTPNMLVHFRKLGGRRYSVLVEPEHGPALVAHPAPGYDDHLPHDLLHFVAEAEWGIDGAIFGQLAAGRDPGIFLPVDDELMPQWLRRRKMRRRVRPRGLRSEVLAHVLECSWKATRLHRPLPDYWDDYLIAARVDPDHVERVVASLDDLADRWRRLQVGDQLTLTWPRPGRRPRPPATRRREKRGRRLPI
jgi:hypothetical protein